VLTVLVGTAVVSLTIFANAFVHASTRPRKAWSKQDQGITICGTPVRMGTYPLAREGTAAEFTDDAPTCMWCAAGRSFYE
jgi:hypothetical protein